MVLFAACIASATFVAPRQVRALQSVSSPLPVTTGVAILQSVVLSGLAAFTGTLLGPRVGLNPPLYEALRNGSNAALVVGDQFVPTIFWTAVAFAGHLILYYLLFRPRLPANDVILGERLRLALGLPARVLQGGIIEEVQFRWGLMSLLAWLFGLVVGRESAGVMWSAVIASGLGFGLFHLAGAFQLGMERSNITVAATVVPNLWGGLIFGWLFWQVGLLPAMSAHALLHVLWMPIERPLLRRLMAQK